ncbi:MAG: chromosomal replication initiator protein DnaA [Candidatus Fermentibacteraceae bacterium]|nr:chromosomal replication initiator protein DnaA [Candidatus Fermentibacteraceae bacterium]MBN2609638.1 chromosomal replication initiator protein DnaA [Candidatus Fermentibacteraceae bacterium]
MNAFNPLELWNLCLQEAEKNLESTEFESWLKNSTYEDINGTRMVIRFRNSFVAGHVKSRFGSMLEEILREIAGRNDLALQFVGDPAKPGPSSSDAVTPDNSSSSDSMYLRSNYTFDHFVVGPNNQLAHAGALAVSRDAGSTTYNPLFIYGGVGLGKTHLIQAIAHRLRQEDSRRTFRYLSTEYVVGTFIKCVLQKDYTKFRLLFQGIDYLLMDDIQFLEGKVETQEAFFHRFNELHQQGKQIVLTSDRPPHELKDLPERLISRFQWGLVADIKPPEYETRLAILMLLVRDEELDVSHEVLDYIASSIRKNVRQLSGVIHRLAAISRLTGCNIDMNMAQKEIKSTLGTIARRLTPGTITSAVAEVFDISPGQLKGKQRKRNILVPRQVAISLIRELTSMSLKDIGAFFSGRDHSTVLNSIERIQELRESDPELNRRIEEIKRKLVSI